MSGPSVHIYQIPGHDRSRVVCRAMLEGLTNLGVSAAVQSSLGYLKPTADVTIFYGLAGKLGRALREIPAAGKTVLYIDLGYWGRKDGTKEGRFTGFHKISVNGRHPTEYFQDRSHPADRIEALGIRPAPWRQGGQHVVLAAMGPKGSAAEGYQPLGWEAHAAHLIRSHSRRDLLYRPKPNVTNPPRLPGAIMAPADQPLADALNGAHALVAHHSNAAVEAITAGVPAFVVEGVALPMASTDISTIESPRRPDGREQWLADIAYVQWSVAEMARGLPWLHLKSEGLV